MPARLTSPGVTFRPTRLSNEAGRRMEPPVSSPRPTAPRLAATAAPVPLLDPPGSCAGLYGFFVTPDFDE